MKKNQNRAKLNTGKDLETFPSLYLRKIIFALKGNFSFDIFQYVKTENEKLQIVYANIRV